MSRFPEALPSGIVGSFRVASALRAGTTASRLRARDLDRPFWGVRTVRPRLELPSFASDADVSEDGRDAARRASVVAYAVRMSPRSFLSHHSAARIFHLPLPWSEAEAVHVSVLLPHRAPRGAGVAGHAIDARLVSVGCIDGLRVATPASVWVQLAPWLSVRDLVAVGDAIVRVPRTSGGRPGDPATALATVAHLRNAMTAGRRIGADRLRAALPLIRVGASSRPETHLRLEIRGANLPEPRLDFEVRDRAGSLLGVSELAYPSLRIALEYEGDHHRWQRGQWNRDIDKYERYAREGWEVVRITAEHLYGGKSSAALRVREALLRRGWRP